MSVHCRVRGVVMEGNWGQQGHADGLLSWLRGLVLGRVVVLQAAPHTQQHWHHLGACWKCKFSGPTHDLLIWGLTICVLIRPPGDFNSLRNHRCRALAIRGGEDAQSISGLSSPVRMGCHLLKARAPRSLPHSSKTRLTRQMQ